MEYIVAQYRIRTSGKDSDIVACGIRGFAPFAVEIEPEAEATMELTSECRVDKSAYAELVELSSFGFEEDLAQCTLYRYQGGYLFEMVKGDVAYMFTKEDGSNVVRSNYALFESVDASLLRFGLWLMFGLCIVPLGAIAIHSSVLVKDGGAVLCLGESGTGKSTHTRLWREHIEGTTLLNDDSPIIRLVDGVPTAFGSPWSGKTPCYRNLSFPIRGFIRLSQAPYNKIHRLPVLNAIGALLPSCPPAFAYDDALQDSICDTLSDMISRVPVFHLECLPDAAAAELSYNTIFRR
ncbi:MAG: hypothetical protein E7139_03170 [Rikenellaceae bacterium]|nr:hypothetical protein [Rikenellaceae bacterium]